MGDKTINIRARSTFDEDGIIKGFSVADYATLEELKAAQVPAGRYAICSAVGAIKFGPRDGEQAGQKEFSISADFGTARGALTSQHGDPRQPASHRAMKMRCS